MAEVKGAGSHKAALTTWKIISLLLEYHVIHRYVSDTTLSVNWRNNSKLSRIKLSLTPALKERLISEHSSRYYSIHLKIEQRGKMFQNVIKL